jgi:hypothetical protein
MQKQMVGNAEAMRSFTRNSIICDRRQVSSVAALRWADGQIMVSTKMTRGHEHDLACYASLREQLVRLSICQFKGTRGGEYVTAVMDWPA